MRGRIHKTENETEIRLERRMLTKEQMLVLDKAKCIGCGICVDLCPRRAIEYRPAEFKDRHILNRSSIDLKNADCVLCGECLVACPVMAFCMLVEGEERVPVVESNVFATLMRRREI